MRVKPVLLIIEVIQQVHLSVVHSSKDNLLKLNGTIIPLRGYPYSVLNNWYT